MRAGSRIVAWAAVACGTLALTIVLTSAAGCVRPSRPLVISDDDPTVKIRAYKKAVRQKDRAAVGQLVADLESDDPAVRFYAIRGLRDLTGEDFGYVYYDGEDRRKAAVLRWRQWLAAREQQTGRPKR